MKLNEIKFKISGRVSVSLLPSGHPLNWLQIPKLQIPMVM